MNICNKLRQMGFISSKYPQIPLCIYANNPHLNKRELNGNSEIKSAYS